MQKVFLSGAVTGHRLYRVRFWVTTLKLRLKGYNVLNPAVLPKWLEHDDAMHICFGMIDVADAVYLMRGWGWSNGANMEHDYALNQRKKVLYEFIHETRRH